MKQATYITLVIFTVLFAVLSATAHGFKDNIGPYGNIDMRMTMIQSMLDLNDEQTKDVENIFRANMRETKEIIKSHGLTRGDIKVMRMMQNKFRQQTMENLAVILDQEQLMTLRQDVFGNSPFAFIELAAIETPELLLESLGISEEEASQVLSILEEMKNKREIVLVNLGFDHEMVASFRQDMESKRNEMQEDLRTVLSNEQLEQLEEFRSRMSQKRQGQLSHFQQKGM
jgi:hypothetical protein